ncbi:MULTISPECIES: hypothetical protein [Zobellia]|uniref:hypothetical protein n=1 Tax=Zobellia TaxID=112040 RepID=UPI001BFF1928|nr:MULTISPECIES: hypothetical protein [Zobellia]MBT9186985.1 hypothetical protein [Zobellia russellii]MDO6818139.1 hypothetical protein [Zobellia sp. 1_MG-2023]
MAFDELKESISEAEASAKSYIESSREFYKLKAFKMLMKGITGFAQAAFIAIAVVLALLFLSVSAGFFIGAELENTALGFLIVGGFYILVGILVFVFRRSLVKPLMARFSELYFEEI